MNLFGLVTYLDEVHTGKVLSLWGELEEKCGLVGVKAGIRPHFTWLAFQEGDLPGVESALEAFAETAQPFSVQINGLGIFTGEDPVLYIPIVVTAQLAAFHEALWARVSVFGGDEFEHHAPGNWVPHITLARLDLTPDNLGCAMETLAFQNNHWQFEVEDIVFASYGEEALSKFERRFAFKG